MEKIKIENTKSEGFMMRKALFEKRVLALKVHVDIQRDLSRRERKIRQKRIY